MKDYCSFYTRKIGKMGKEIKIPQPTQYPC